MQTNSTKFLKDDSNENVHINIIEMKNYNIDDVIDDVMGLLSDKSDDEESDDEGLTEEGKEYRKLMSKGNQEEEENES